MTDNERRAETEAEAVARALYENGDPERPPFDASPIRDSYLKMADTAVAALDRVRDARGDECEKAQLRESRDNWKRGYEAKEAEVERLSAARSPQDDCPDCRGGRPKWAGTMPASPCPTCDGSVAHETRMRECVQCGSRTTEEVCSHDGYATRPLSRDGTVAVEDVIGALKVAVMDLSLAAASLMRLGGGVSAQAAREAAENARRVLAEFSPASTGDQE